MKHKSNTECSMTGAMPKGLAILEALVRDSSDASISRIAKRLQMSPPTAHRIAAALEELGFIERQLGQRQFVEGRRLVELALNTLRSAVQRPPRHAILESVASATKETCNVGVLVDGQIQYLDRVETNWPLALRFAPGSRVPVHCTAQGKLLLSYLEPDAVKDFLRSTKLKRFTPHTIRTPKELLATLKKIRADGYALDEMEFIAGTYCIAVPVRNRSGRVCAALALSAPGARVDRDTLRGHLPLLRNAAEKLGHGLA